MLTPNFPVDSTIPGANEKNEPEHIARIPSHQATDSTRTLVDGKQPFKLSDIDFEIGRNELVAIVGGVGSGKSSLLAALAGEMRRTSGEVILGASRAFCPQYAWVQNTTVQNNILFGKRFDPTWYQKVVEACALLPDLSILPNGDATEIGERGITLSGGQKQRLNIARAIYFDADIILLDDPLNAVDAHVGKHIFDQAICGLLKNKCRILATHQLHVLHRCDRIIWFEEGRIVANDTFQNLMETSHAFSQMMLTENKHEKQDVSDQTHKEIIVELKEENDVKEPAAIVQLMQEEERAVKSVPWSLYTSYLHLSGSILNGPLILALLILTQGANITTSLWLSYWTEIGRAHV